MWFLYYHNTFLSDYALRHLMENKAQGASYIAITPECTMSWFTTFLNKNKVHRHIVENILLVHQIYGAPAVIIVGALYFWWFSTAGTPPSWCANNRWREGFPGAQANTTDARPS
jgi:hypothetical protein